MVVGKMSFYILIAFNSVFSDMLMVVSKESSDTWMVANLLNSGSVNSEILLIQKDDDGPCWAYCITHYI